MQSTTNLGFAAANNLGVQYAFGKCLLFLNPDTELAGPAIDRMMEFLETHNDAGIVGARLLNSDPIDPDELYSKLSHGSEPGH